MNNTTFYSVPVTDSTPSVVHVNNWTYCNLHPFQRSFASVHGYLSLMVCVFGSVANLLNICVLTRKEMRNPTNLILTGLAVADLLVMLDYTPYVCHVHLSPRDRSDLDRFSYGSSVFILFHSIFTQVCHTVAIILTVILAVWRYVYIAHPQRVEWCNFPRTKLVIFASYILSPIICIPLFTTSSIHAQNFMLDLSGNRIPKPQLQNYSLQTQNRTLYLLRYRDDQYINFWVYGIVIKIIPCILLTVLSLRLIFALLQTKRRRQVLLTPLNDEFANLRKKAKMQEKERQADRTTRMLLAVLLLFLLTEFPQGILGLLSDILGERFFNECYIPLGDVMDVLALINSAINFILYCSMSRQFRTTFRLMFCPKFLNTWVPVSRPKSTVDSGPPTQFTQL